MVRLVSAAIRRRLANQIRTIALCVLVCSIGTASADAASLETKPDNLLVEGIASPLNVHSANPRLSWHSNVSKQSHYQIQVGLDPASLALGSALSWDSGKIASAKSINVEYSGKQLETGGTAFWRVRVWQEGADEASEWSDTGFWQMGLLAKSDWQAHWIQAARPTIAENSTALERWIAFAANEAVLKDEVQEHVLEKLRDQPTASLFRRQFSVSKMLIRAKLHSTAAGYYEIFVNGEKISDRLMDPGQTDYAKRILYNTDDVTSLVADGSNTIAVHLGSAWYNEEIAFSKPDRDLSYGRPSFIVQLELYYDDGSSEFVTTDDQWLSYPSPILKEGLFSGEFYDAAKIVRGWNTSADDTTLKDWQNVQVLSDWPTLALEPQLLPAIRALTELSPERIYETQEHVWVVDFGQNFTGVPTLDLTQLGLDDGQAIFLRYAEWADSSGNISQKSGGRAPLLKQVDAYVATGDDQSSWTPTFTWHGFRYMEISGLKSAPDPAAITAHLLRSDVKRTGTFESSDALLNRIHDMALWSYEGNLMGLPMDCPIRERAGWTGDAHAALITGNYNFDMQNFWRKYLGDFRTSVHIAPAIVPGRRSHGGNFDWAVAEVLIAWELYRHHGDKQILRDQYASLLDYMQAAEDKLQGSLIRVGYGDWCDPVRKPGMDRVGGRCTPQQTSPTITSSALYAHAADLMSKISSILDRQAQSVRYRELYDSVSKQFHAEFYDPATGHYGSQTADAMALRFGITPPELRQSVADALNRDVVESWGGHASVGALGQTYLYRALSDYGYADTAFDIFKADGYPGYSDLLDELHATTLWERKGGFDPAADPTGKTAPGRSLNHPFHSGYDGWFYEGLGGIRPLEDSVGYQVFELKPNFVTDLEWVEVSYATDYGDITSNWRRDENGVEWSFQIPNNTSAWVTLPDKKKKLFSAGNYSLVLEDASESIDSGAQSAERPQATQPPNILLILSDDHAWTDYGFMGHEHIRTPSIDRLASEGVTFSRGYVPTALCRPSLLTIATGLYASQHGVSGNGPSRLVEGGKDSPAYQQLRAQIIDKIDQLETLPELLRSKGYVSLQTGKWWEGSYRRGGFDEGMTRGFPEAGGRHGDDGLKIGREGLETITQFIDQASSDNKPFFVWYAPYMPHSPHNPPQRLLENYQNQGLPDSIAKYYAMVEWFDETNGQLFSYLDENGLKDNTLIVYVADNGWVTNPDQTGRFLPRSKQSPDDKGVRTPIIFSLPGQFEPQMRSELVSSIDIVPTILAAVGLDVPGELPGENIYAAMKQQTVIDRDTVYGEGFAHDMVDINDPEASLLYRWVIEGDWKLILSYDGVNESYQKYHVETLGEPRLYDLSVDDSESINLAARNPELVERLSRKLVAWYPVEARQILQE